MSGAVTLQSLPHDIIWCILAQIDNKPDLANFCAALPNTAGALTKQWASLYDGLYWQEIEEHHLTHLAVLDLIFNGDDTTAKALGPPSRWYPTYRPVKRIPEPRQDVALNRSVRRALAPETACRLKEIHTQIERMAEIFMEYQLEGHHPPPETYQQPSLDERRKAITAVYNAWLIGLRVLVEFTGTDPSVRTYTPGSGIADVYNGWYRNIWTEWTFWELKEARVVFDTLWKEIPRRLSEQFFTEQDFRVNKKDGRDKVTRFLDFIFAGHQWNAGMYLKLFDVEGSGDGGNMARAEMSKHLANYGVATMGLSPPGPATNSISRMLLERLDSNQRLRLQFLYKFDQALQSHERTARGDWNYDENRSLELRRLMGSRLPPPPNDLLKFKFVVIGGGSTPWNWTRMGNVMIEDCIWDDWRLRGWGYRFPQIDYEKHRVGNPYD